MPDDITTPDEEQDDLTPVVHDDIMKRLLDYQRQFREGSEPQEAAEDPRAMVDYSAMEAQAAIATATAADEVVDLTEIEEAETEIEVIEIEEVATPEAVQVAEAEAMRKRVAQEAVQVAESPTAEETELEPEISKAEVAELTMAEPTKVEGSTPAAEGGLAERVEQLEAALERIAMMLGAVRSDFQDLAIRADERISEIEDALAAVRGSSS